MTQQQVATNVYGFCASVTASVGVVLAFDLSKHQIGALLIGLSAVYALAARWVRNMKNEDTTK